MDPVRGPDSSLALPVGNAAHFPQIAMIIMGLFAAAAIWKLILQPTLGELNRTKIRGSQNPFAPPPQKEKSPAAVPVLPDTGDELADDTVTDTDTDTSQTDDQWKLDIKDKPVGAVVPESFDYGIFGSPRDAK